MLGMFRLVVDGFVARAGSKIPDEEADEKKRKQVLKEGAIVRVRPRPQKLGPIIGGALGQTLLFWGGPTTFFVPPFFGFLPDSNTVQTTKLTHVLGSLFDLTKSG